MTNPQHFAAEELDADETRRDDNLPTFPGTNRPLPSTLDPETIAQAVVNRVMASETVEQMFDVWEGETSDKLVNRVFTILDAEWGWYDSETGPIPLAMVNAVNKETGEVTVFPTTSRNLTAFIFNAQERHLLPFTARIIGEHTRSGRTALRFGRP